MHYNSHRLQFYMSAENDCPYLEGQRERKIFTTLSAESGQRLQNQLSHQGFRRSQNIIYKPVCQNCAACLSARIPVGEFQLSKNHRRIKRKNRDLVREIHPANATDEQFDLFERYVATRHKDGGMGDMNIHDYAAMVEQANTPVRMFEYRLMENGRAGTLVGAVLTDILEDGLSMVYSFFDPELTERSLGTYMILDQLQKCAEIRLDHLYLGFWVKGSHNMEYKKRFKPLELFINGEWTRFDNPDDARPLQTDAQRILLNAHRALEVGSK